MKRTVTFPSMKPFALMALHDEVIMMAAVAQMDCRVSLNIRKGFPTALELEVDIEPEQSRLMDQFQQKIDLAAEAEKHAVN